MQQVSYAEQENAANIKNICNISNKTIKYSTRKQNAPAAQIERI